MIIVDGDDQLIGRQVFKLFNTQFQTKNAWLVYTNFIIKSSLTVGYSRIYPFQTIKRNEYRKAPFTISHLRAFYTKLFTMIKQQDLKNENGDWYRAANDIAMYIPIAEMVHQKILYCPEIAYVYNSFTGLNNHLTKSDEQKTNADKIRIKNKYKPVM